MKNIQSGLTILVILLFQVMASSVLYSQKASGYVFLDSNKNGIKEKNEKGLPGVSVSNGSDVVQTDSKGRWKLPVTDDTGIFVIKPADYSVSVNENMIPQYFYLNKPEGSPELKVKGVSPTGKLPKSVDFPLYYKPEDKKFTALFFGDTQASSPVEVNYINHDVVEELIGTDANFGVVLGDIVGHDQGLFKEISEGIAQTKIPWHYIFGNHDSNQDATENRYRDETFERFFGPSTYAFEVGDVAFVGFNNLYFNEEGKYSPRFLPTQIQFLKNYLKFVPDDKLIVLMMHVPIYRCDGVDEIFNLLKNRPHTFSISGHVHDQMNVFVDEKLGWHGNEPHHHLINATVCGSWWSGLKDETGIPHATMNDGAPNGYSIITFDGNRYKVRFKAARREAKYQMNIYVPDKVSIDSVATTKVLVNVFAGSERSVVKMKVDNGDEWVQLEKADLRDPGNQKMYELSPILEQEYEGKAIESYLGWTMDKPHISKHIWEGNLPENLKTGVHTVKINTIDMYGQEWKAYRIFYVY